MHVKILEQNAKDSDYWQHKSVVPKFTFNFLSTSKEITLGEHLQYDLFSAEWSFKP